MHVAETPGSPDTVTIQCLNDHDAEIVASVVPLIPAPMLFFKTLIVALHHAQTDRCVWCGVPMTTEETNVCDACIEESHRAIDSFTEQAHRALEARGETPPEEVQ